MWLGEGKSWESLCAWFLGPRAENRDLLEELIKEAIDSHVNIRKSYDPQETDYITEDNKQSDKYKKEVEKIRRELKKILNELEKSVPFYSTRYRGHMLWDTTMPAVVGYIAGLMYNQNNVATEASPETSIMEQTVGDQLCDMLGFVNEGVKPWGHITSGGSVANIEAIWVARNIKYFPLAVKQAVMEEPDLKSALVYKVTTAQGRKVSIKEAKTWDMLNISVDDTVRMSIEVAKMAGFEENLADFNDLLSKYSLQSLGLFKFLTSNSLSETGVIIAPASLHYSLPKAATVLGLGDSAVREVELDKNGRLDMSKLKNILDECLDSRIAVLSVVAVIGTTEEGAVDPLYDILKLREDFQTKGLNFCIHGDAAWGGYLATMIDRTLIAPGYVIQTPLNDHTEKCFEKLHLCDTITVDPHKNGLIPYPAGALCYRNGMMRGFLTPTAAIDYIHSLSSSYPAGMVSLEGSKPGAAAVATLLSHNVIGLNTKGYGMIMAQCMTGAKMFYSLLLTLTEDGDPFVCQPLRPVPRARVPDIPKIKTKIMKPFEEIELDKWALEFLREVGPDANVNAFAINMKDNKDIGLAKQLTEWVFKRLSHVSAWSGFDRVPLYLSKSERTKAIGEDTLNKYKARVGLPPGPEPLPFFIASSLNPWEVSFSDMCWMKDTLRDIITTGVRKIKDPPLLHTFVSISGISEANILFCDYITDMDEQGRHHHAIIKIRIETSQQFTEQSREEIHLLKTQKQSTLPTIVHRIIHRDGETQKIPVDIQLATPSSATFSGLMEVLDVIRLRSILNVGDRFWLYGEEDSAFLSCQMTRNGDRVTTQQVARLQEIPTGLDKSLLSYGFKVEIDADFVQPGKTYTINYRGVGGKQMSSTIRLSNTIWPASNDGCEIQNS
eukprot:GFUD01086737.1.p1 GENE.GFUD01086737.1~~GFUD01086737.1.p1  ORF type:complete len:892 (-),score=197.69 GFUD01086737.1:481-3156(-)